MTGSNTTTRRIDWQAYSKVFLERYILPSKSDAFIQEKLQHIRRGRALDIGGGVTGTGFLLNWALQYRLLDPFVDSNLHSTNWELESPPRGIPRSYDVVLARGSLNYLSVPQIRLAANLTRGVFAFNTFKHPSNGERQYSSKTGSGIERYEFFNGAGPFGKIVHTLCPDNDTPIVHEFFYYPVDFLVNILQSEGLSCEIQEFGNTVVFFCIYDKLEKQEEEKEKELQTKSEVCKENTILEIMLEALCPDCGVSPGCKHHGLLQDGLVGPQVYGSCGNSIKVWFINDNEYCSFSDCRKAGSNPFLVIFGNGKFGVFVRECEEHPLENILNTVVIPFQTPNTVEASHIMRGMRAVSEVMES